LAIADFGWGLTVILTYLILLINTNAYGFGVCVLFRALFQLFAGASVFWTFCISVFLYVRFLWPQLESIYLWIAFHLFSWGIPLLFIIILAAGGWFSSSALKICYPVEPYHTYFWFVPITGVFVCTFIVYLFLILRISIIVGRKNKQTKQDNYKLSVSLGVRVSLYLLVLLISWSLDIIESFMAEFKLCTAYFGLLLSYIILLQLQGLFDAIVFGATNKQFRQYFAKQRLWQKLINLLFAPILLLPALLRFMYRKANSLGDTYEELVESVN